MKINLDKETHTYTADGLVIPSVTEILSAEGLINLWDIPVYALEQAKKLGSAVHLACEYKDRGVLKESTLDINIRPYLDAWLKFLSDYQAELLKIEHVGYSKKWGFAGTVDRVAAVRGKLILIDIKTTSVLNPAVDIQLAGYKIIYEEIAKEKVSQRWAVQLLPNNYKIHHCKNLYDESVFLSALQVHKWKKKNKVTDNMEYTKETFSG